MASWHVIRSKPRKEILLQQQLLAHGVEVFFPQININPVNPRAAKTQPYFPGYMFVHVDVERVGFSLLNWMPYSLGLVCFGREIPRVPEELIRAIQRQVSASRMAEPAPAFRHGDLVMIERGPFAGYKAMFDTALSGTERVRVLLLLLQRRQLAIDLPLDSLRLPIT